MTVRDWPRKPVPAPSLNFGLGGLAQLGLGDNALSALFTPPPPAPPMRQRSGLDNWPYFDDPLARVLGLGSSLDPIPQKR